MSSAADHGTQSPIDIDGRAATDGPGVVEVQFAPTTFRLDGTKYMPLDDQNSIILDGVAYRLVQTHFHRPSEHCLDGQQFAGEMHMVCLSDGGETAVVGVFLSRADGVVPLESAPISLAAAVPSNGRAFRYDGSLTTPPFTEGIKWVVYETPVELPWMCVSTGARPLQRRLATQVIPRREN